MTAPEGMGTAPAWAEGDETQHEVVATALTEYSDEAAAAIGSLMPDLDPEIQAEWVTRERLEYIINSPDYEQLVAVHNGEIVGAATMTRIREPWFDGVGYLGAFVVGSKARGTGAGEKIWDAMNKWCRDNGLPVFEFKTEKHREAAKHFYDKHGATRLDDSILYEKHVDPE